MTFAAMIRLLVFELLEQLGPKNVLLNVSGHLEPHAIASDGMHANDNVICLGITGDRDGLAFAPIEPEWHSCSFAFRFASYRFWFARRSAWRYSHVLLLGRIVQPTAAICRSSFVQPFCTSRARLRITLPAGSFGVGSPVRTDHSCHTRSSDSRITHAVVFTESPTPKQMSRAVDEASSLAFPPAIRHLR
jgi:hypothetical protein